jgi:hypothetical protein
VNVRLSALAAAATVIAATVTIAACNSNKNAATDAGAKSSSSAGALTAGSSAAGNAGDSADSSVGGSTSTSPADVCALVSVATVAQLSGQAYTTATRESRNFGSTCAYDNDDSTIEGVNLSVDNQNVDRTWQFVHTASVTDVGGVGDKAVWDNENTLYAVSGGLIIQVNGLDSQAKSEALAKALLAALS